MQRTTSSAAFAIICLWPAAHASAASCESVSTLNLANTKVTMASEVAPARSTSGSGRTRRRAGSGIRGSARVLPCRGDADALGDSDIINEVWLPISGWNGKFQAVGNGAWQGSIGYAAMAEALRRERDELYRHRSRRRKRQLRNGAPREGHRFRVSLRTRDDRERKSNHQRVLRQRAEFLTGTDARLVGDRR